MDELKKYLQNNRGQIDTDLPDENLWKDVKDKLHPAARIPAFVKWMAAACLLAAIGIGIYFLTPDGKTKNMAMRLSKDTIHSLPVKPLTPAEIIATGKENTKRIFTEKKDSGKQLIPVTVVGYVKKKSKPAEKRPPVMYGFEEIEASYATMLDIQLERLRTLPIYAEGPEYFDLFKKRFADLAKEEEKLKRKFRQGGYHDELIDELITIYQQKITVLKQLQFEINRMNSKVRQTDAGIHLQKPSYINL